MGYNEEVREKINSYLKQHPRLTQERFARLTGVDVSTISKLRNGKYGSRISECTRDKIMRVIRGEIEEPEAAKQEKKEQLRTERYLGRFDYAIAHLNRARKELESAQEEIELLTSFLVKKISDIVQLRSFLKQIGIGSQGRGGE